MPNVRTTTFLLAAATSVVVDYSALADSQPCRSMDYERNAYTICEVDLGKHTVRGTSQRVARLADVSLRCV